MESRKRNRNIPSSFRLVLRKQGRLFFFSLENTIICILKKGTDKEEKGLVGTFDVYKI